MLPVKFEAGDQCHDYKEAWPLALADEVIEKGCLAAIAHSRLVIQERVRAGLARARGEGKRLGRRPNRPPLEKRIREALATRGRPSVRVIAKQFGVDPGTVQWISRPFEQDAVAL